MSDENVFFFFLECICPLRFEMYLKSGCSYKSGRNEEEHIWNMMTNSL